MKFKKYRMWYACFIYVMRQTNLKLDPRGPTPLLPLLTVELIIPRSFWCAFTLVVFIGKKMATLYRIWLTQDQILMIAMKGHFVNEVYGKWDTVGAIWNKILLSCHFMSYVTFFPASILRIYIPRITFPQVMKLNVVSR